MAAKPSVLGLSFSDRSVQAVEIEHAGLTHTLLAADEWENSLFSSKSMNGEGEARFTEYLQAFMKVNQVKARRASVALDSSRLFLNTIPMEAGMSRPDVNEHVNWELSQYFPDTSPRAFITDSHTLAQHPTEGWDEMLHVSVKRDHAFLVQKVIAHLGLDLHIVDVDHFAADTALRINYPDTRHKHLALVGVKETRLDISIIKNGIIESYSYCQVGSDREIVEQIATISRETKTIHSITVYGPHIERDLLVQIRRSSALLVEALNPLRHVRVSDTLRLSDRLSVPSYRFAAAVGVALRRD